MEVTALSVEGKVTGMTMNSTPELVRTSVSLVPATRTPAIVDVICRTPQPTASEILKSSCFYM